MYGRESGEPEEGEWLYRDLKGELLYGVDGRASCCAPLGVLGEKLPVIKGCPTKSLTIDHRVLLSGWFSLLTLGFFGRGHRTR